jgi:uncharacterized protein (TIGR03086 family)
MTPRTDEIFDRGLDFFGETADRLGPDDWDRPSPCEDWTALDVLGHLSTSVEMGISVLAGEQPTWPKVDRPADLVVGDPAAQWHELAGRARAALDGADLDEVMDTPMGPSKVVDRLAFPAIDLYVHAWDLAHSADLDVEVPADVIEFAHQYLDPIPDDRMRGPNGAFGPEAAAPANATPTEAFIAFTGRSPR